MKFINCEFNDNFCFYVFSRVHATLQPALSVCRSVRRSSAPLCFFSPPLPTRTRPRKSSIRPCLQESVLLHFLTRASRLYIYQSHCSFVIFSVYPCVCPSASVRHKRQEMYFTCFFFSFFLSIFCIKLPTHSELFSVCLSRITLCYSKEIDLNS